LLIGTERERRTIYLISAAITTDLCP